MKLKVSYFLYSVLFLISNYSFSQFTKLNRFCTKADYVGFCLSFKNDSLFDYQSWTCLEGIEGHGSYTLSKKILTLHFTTTDSLKSSTTIKNIECDMEEKTKLHISVRDHLNNTPLAGCTIQIKNVESVIAGAISDINGNVEMKFNKSSAIYTVSVKYIGYQTDFFNIKADSCNSVIILLVPSPSFEVKNGTEWVYKIKRHNRRKLILIPEPKEDQEIIKSRKEIRLRANIFTKTY
jgi:hypothetical protein